MQKNVASQKLVVFAFDSTTNLPKTGDAANITAYVSKDYGSVTVLGDTSATEMDSTNAKGYYLFDLTQTETNADTLLFSAKSTTSNIVVIGCPACVFTAPPNFTTLAIDSSGNAKADVAKLLGTAWLTPTVAGTPDVNAKQLGGQTAALNANNFLKVSLNDILATTLTETSGQLAGGFKKFFNVAAPASTMDALTLVATATTLTNLPAITAGWLTATGIAADAITAAKVAADVGTEIGTAVWASATRTLSSLAGLTLDTVTTVTALGAFISDYSNNELDVTILRNVSGSVGSVAAGGITTAAFAAGATIPRCTLTDTVTALSVAERAAVADKLLGRNIAGGSDGGRTVTTALAALRNKVVISGLTMTVYDTDDTTSLWTAALTGDATADPITAVDPG